MTTNIVPIKDTEQFTELQIQEFEKKYMPTIQKYAECVKQKKQFEKEENKFKDHLGKIMDKLGIKTMDSAFVKFTRVAAGKDTEVFDPEALKEKEPELYQELFEDYHKTKKGKSAYVTFTVK